MRERRTTKPCFKIVIPVLIYMLALMGKYLFGQIHAHKGPGPCCTCSSHMFFFFFFYGCDKRLWPHARVQEGIRRVNQYLDVKGVMEVMSTHLCVPDLACA